MTKVVLFLDLIFVNQATIFLTVSFSVQLAAAYALLDIISADTVKITQVVGDWTNGCSKIDDTLKTEFERRMKEVRENMWAT